MANTQYSESTTHWQPEFTKIVDGQPVRFRDFCVHEFYLSDVEDPVILAGGPMWDWQESEAGEWVIANAEEKPYWVKDIDPRTYSYRFRIMARLSEHNYTFFKLKFGCNFS
jgi:hypothetical protein